MTLSFNTVKNKRKQDGDVIQCVVLTVQIIYLEYSEVK